MTYSDEIKKIQQGPFAELYKFKAGDESWYYTTYEKEVVFESNTYEPRPIKRSSFTYDDKLKAQRIKISAPMADPLKRYISHAPPEPTRVTITRVFVDTPNFFKVLFIGEVIGITMQKGIAEADCESTSLIFRNKIPLWCHQAFCNNQLYDGQCTVDRNAFKISAVITISGNDLISAAFTSQPSDWLTLGHVLTAYNDIRLITNHVGDTITLQIPFDSRLASGATVTAFAGCDKKYSTCDTKFANFPNFKGFPFIPANNPVIYGA